MQRGQIPGLNKHAWLVCNSAEMLCFYAAGKFYLFNKTDTLLNFILNVRGEKKIPVLCEIQNFEITKCVNSFQPCIFFFRVSEFR